VLAAQGQHLELAAGILEEAPLPSKTSTGPVIPCRAARAQNTPLRESLAEVAAFQLEICPPRLRFREICDETAMPMAWRIWARVRPNRREAAAAAAITWKLAPPQPRLTPWEALSERPKRMS
jgi:hypothetical protein